LPSLSLKEVIKGKLLIVLLRRIVMRVLEYFDANTFFDVHREILLEREAACQLLLGHLLFCIDDGASDISFGSVVDDMAVHLLFCKFPSKAIVIYTVNKEHLAAAAEELAEYLADDGSLINEIKGSSDACQHFVGHFEKSVACSFARATEYDIMEIRQINDIKPADGIQRAARADEAQLVADWMIESQLEAKSSEMDYEAMLKKAEQYIADKRVFLFEKEDIVVSMAVKEKRLINGVLLSYIYTPVEYRGEGYAAANLYYLSKALLDEGYEYCTILVDKKNPLTVRAYEKIGYQVLDEFSEYRLISAE